MIHPFYENCVFCNDTVNYTKTPNSHNYDCQNRDCLSYFDFSILNNYIVRFRYESSKHHYFLIYNANKINNLQLFQYEYFPGQNTSKLLLSYNATPFTSLPSATELDSIIQRVIKLSIFS